jgi:hypothetical protein
MVRHVKPSKPKLPSSDDVFVQMLREECARAAVEWLKGINIKRPICSLTMPEMCNLVEAITARWIVLVSQRAPDAPLTEEEKNAYAWLLG